MIEQIDYDKLIKGQMYLIDNLQGQKENLVFDDYSFFKYPNSKFSFQLHLPANNFYRYISKEEFYTKTKEKYDAKCLNIILKRLIDESFQSNFL